MHLTFSIIVSKWRGHILKVFKPVANRYCLTYSDLISNSCNILNFKFSKKNSECKYSVYETSLVKFQLILQDWCQCSYLKMHIIEKMRLCHLAEIMTCCKNFCNCITFLLFYYPLRAKLVGRKQILQKKQAMIALLGMADPKVY